ncbi:MAG TPA: FG-GAP repeat protein [Herpetosiphonaceae bacterium]|nr:FG-GAP repeat protein [Herpetosiphonaceae bacterium]
MHARRYVGILLLIAVALSTVHVKVGAASRPAGLSAGDWRDIQSQPRDDSRAAPAGYLKAPNPLKLARFGSAVSISGDTLVVGAPGTLIGSPEIIGNGAAYVFVRDGDGWTRQADLQASNPGIYDYFGTSVAISGDTIVVGAPGEAGDGSGSADNSVEGAGAAYVFTRADGVWTEQAYLKADQIGQHYKFGASVAIDGDTIVAGMPNGPATGYEGAAYVFGRTNGAWSQQAYLTASNAKYGDSFGFSVGIDGDIVVVGARWESSDGSGPSDESATDAGAAYVFERASGAWTEQAYLKAPNPEPYDIFGTAVAIDGGTIAVGAPHTSPCCLDARDGDPAEARSSSAGEVFVFVRGGQGEAAWVRQAALNSANANGSDYFGVSVAIDGDRIVAGAYGEDSDGSGPADNSASAAGAAYLFVRASGAWTQHGYRKAFNPDASDYFGAAVAVEGAIIAVGATDESSDGSGPADNSLWAAGSVYVQRIGARLAMPVVMRP